MRRLRVRPSQPSLRGPRETLPGPTTWVRPATGWWKRMKAGESPLNQGRSVWAPLSVSRRRSRGLRKTPQWSAERRAGPRYGSAVPSRWRDRLSRKAANGCGDPRPRISALRYPLLGMRRVRIENLARQSAGMRRAAMMTHDSTMHGERNDDVEVCADDFPSSCPRLSRASTPCLPLRKAWMAGTSPAMTNDGFWRNEPEKVFGVLFWRNEPEV